MPNKSLIMVGMVAAIGTLVITLLAPRITRALDDNQIIAGAKRIQSVSSSDLESACNKSGGTYVETGDDYVCATDSSWVYCEKKSGDCVGETNNKDGKKKNSRFVNRQKTRVRTGVSGKKPRRRERRSYPMGTAPIKR